MTNWPNIQEYRNFEAKFFDNSKDKNLNNSAENSNDVETVQRNEYNDKIYSDNSYNNVTTNHFSESKTVRCVIRKDFEEAFKKLDRGDGLALNCEGLRPKIQETSTVDQSVVDKIRLQNHLKWKKQKEEEYLQKKEAERIAQLKKKEEESRLERLKKEREKERLEKLKEWQEHKAREKEEKKREKMVMKELEEELKGVTFTVDKEKLIAEWVKIKNRQKQMEAVKKAEMLKKEEEHRALRQNLAELSYKQWKERLKGRMISLPKNGYQIFGPKPTPVVKEDWNHNFASSSSPRNQIYQDVGLRNTKSNTSTFTLRPTVKEFENFTKESFYLGDLKKRTQSFCQLKTAKTGLNLFGESEASRKKELHEMPLKELQPGTIDLKKNCSSNLKNSFGNKRDRTVCSSASQDLSEESKTFSKNMKKHEATFKQLLSNDYLSLLGNFPREGGDQNHCLSKFQGVKSSTLLDELSESLGLPNKKKIDLYLNANPCDSEEEFPKKIQKKKVQLSKSIDVKVNQEKKKETGGKQNLKEPNKKSFSKEKYSGQTHIASDPVGIRMERKPTEKSVNTELGTKQSTVESQKAKDKTYRRSRSYDKPIKKGLKDAEKVKGCSSSMSFVKVRGPSEDPCKRLKLTKNKTSACLRKSRRRSKPNTPELGAPRRTGDKKAAADSETKPRKKLKKKNAFLSKSLSFSDSPYSVKKNKTKSLEKIKGSRQKNLNKDGDAKTNESGHCRKLTSTKV